MTRTATLLRATLMGACALSLGGCISLLPKTKPAMLYRFGQDGAAAEIASAPASAQVGVLRAGGLFQREAAGDRLLTITGEKVAYVERARWVAPAQVLFDQAVQAAFDADPGPTRLVARGEPVTAKYILRVDVRNFETHYDHGPDAPPEVLVRVRAAIVQSGHNEMTDQMFEARVRAGDNRLGPITGAYDRAVTDVLGKLVAWTNAQVAPAG